MSILSGKEVGMVHTGRGNGDYGVARCMGLFMVRVMSDGLK